MKRNTPRPEWRLLCAVVLSLNAVSPASARDAARPAAPSAEPVASAARFEPNVGQAPGGARFLGRSDGATVLVAPNEITLHDGAGGAVRLRMEGASATAETVGDGRLGGVVNYLRGSDPARWRTNVPTFARVRVRDLYPGIDAVYYGAEDGLEYDFVVAPGRDPGAIRFTVDGARRVEIDRDGALVVETASGTLRQRAPAAYQETPGGRRPVAARFERDGERGVRFAVGAHDPRVPLVIDPVLAFSTYLGGSGTDGANGVAVDAQGNVYVVGTAWSGNFPTQGPVQGALAGPFDAFVTKLAPDGQSLVYSTYLGGDSADQATAIAVDASGVAYVAGATLSPNFPTANAYDATLGGDGTTFDAFVVRLAPNGASLLSSTYLGGANHESASDIAIDSTGAVYVVGGTASADFPATSGAFQTAYGGAVSGDAVGDAFVAKFVPSVASLAYATYLGGAMGDSAKGLAVGADGSVTVCGLVYANVNGGAQFPTVNPIQSTLRGITDGFVSRLNASGSALVFSTHLGGTDVDSAEDVALGPDGSVYVVGTTRSEDFPTANPIQAELGGPFNYSDIFLTRLSAAGTSIVFSTYLGGEYGEEGYAVEVGPSGDVYVAGRSESSDAPVVGALQPWLNSNPDIEESNGYVARINMTTRSLVYATLLGGEEYDIAHGLAVDAAGAAYVVGSTTSFGFPLLRPFQARPTETATGGPTIGENAFVAKIAPGGAGTADVSLQVSASPQPAPSVGTMTYTLTVSNAGPNAATDVTVTQSPPVYISTFSLDYIRPPLQGSTTTQGTRLAAPPVGSFGTVTYALGTIPAGASAVVTSSFALADQIEPESFLLSSYAHVQSSVTDPNGSNNARLHDAVIRPIPPQAPGLEAIVASVAQVDLYSANPLNVLTVEFERKVGAGGTYTQIASVDGNFAAYSDRGLMGGTTYVYRARVLNAGGYSPYSSEVAVTTDAGSCVYTFTSSNIIVLAEGGSSVAHVFAQTGCPFSPTTGTPWIHLSPSQDPYNGFIPFTVDPNPPPEGRVGTIEVAGMPIRVTQQSIASGPDSAGIYVPSTGAWFLRNTNSSGSADAVFTYGPGGSGLVPLSGDWDGDGESSPGLYNPATGAFFLRNSNSSGAADAVFTFGPGGGGLVPLAGDWDGDGDDEVGLYVPATGVFFLRYGLSSGPADIVFSFGPGGAGWVPVVGNFDVTDDRDEVALFAPASSVFFVKNDYTAGPADVVFSFGPAGANWIPIAGDWNNDSVETVGLYAPSTGAIFLRNQLASGPADHVFTYGPPGATPVVGNWDGY